MAGFVLIHGAFCGGWYYDPVAEILRARGHKVIAPDLPGMGGDEAALRAVTLDGWARFTVDQCQDMRREIGGEPLVLAGHSRGGIVIGTAAETDPKAMDALVYIAALMPPDGHSSYSLSAQMPPQPEMPDIGGPVANGAGMMVDPAKAGPWFSQLAPPALARAALERLQAEPAGPLSTPMKLSPERWGSVPRTYIECLQDRTITIATQRKMQELSPGTRTVTLDADHSPMFCMPEALADALEAAV